MGNNRIVVKKPDTTAEHEFVVRCAVQHVASEVARSGGARLPPSGVISAGYTTHLIGRGSSFVGAVTMEAVNGVVYVETVYIDPEWRGRGLLGRTLWVLRSLAEEKGVGLALNAPVLDHVARVAGRVGVQIPAVPEGYELDASVAEGSRWMLAQIRRECPHSPSPCGPCAGAYYRRMLTVGGEYEDMLKGWPRYKAAAGVLKN